MQRKRFMVRVFGIAATGFLLAAVTLALPAFGQSLDWVRQDGGESNDIANAIAVDGDGNSYVTGFFEGTVIFGSGEVNETIFDSLGFRDIFVAKYDDNGALLWARQAGGWDDDVGNGIAVDKDGNIHVTGEFAGMTIFGAGQTNETILTSSGYNDIFVITYNSGGELLWAKKAGGSADGGTGDDRGSDIAVDGENNSYVTGTFNGTATFGSWEENEIILTSTGYDIFVAKYDSEGILLWAGKAGGSADNDIDRGNAIAVDGNGNSYVTGHFNGEAVFGDEEVNETLLANGPYDIFVAKYDGLGTLLWARKAGGPGTDMGNDIAVDGNGLLFVTGSFVGPANFGSGETGDIILTGNGIFVASYDGTGALLWAKKAGSGNGNGIALDGANGIYVTGYFIGTATFGPGEAHETTLTAMGSSDVFVAKFEYGGSLLWVTQEGGSGSDGGESVAADENGNGYVTGFFTGTSAFGFEENETTLTGFGGIDIFVAKIANRTGAIQDLIDLIDLFELNRGIENSLTAKLSNALSAQESENSAQRRNVLPILQSFVNEVEALRGRGLTEEQADRLTSLAGKILAEVQ